MDDLEKKTEERKADFDVLENDVEPVPEVSETNEANVGEPIAVQTETVAPIYESIPVMCRKCGAQIEPGKMFCGNCGTAVNQGDGKKKKFIMIGLAVAVFLAAAILTFILTSGPAITAVSFDETTCMVEIGNKITPDFDISPSEAKASDLKWTSSDSSVATVDKYGVITAVSVGTCNIEASAKDGINASISVTVGEHVSDVAIRDQEVTMRVGEETNLICTVSPANAADKTLRWETSNELVVQVDDNGKLTAVGEGTCTVTATSNNGYSDMCTVSVEAAVLNFMDMYALLDSETWCEIGADGTWMKLDTNPDDIDNDDFTYTYYTSVFNPCNEKIEEVNVELGFSTAVTERMNTTTALQGVQTAESEHYRVQWTYHPDNGLEVLYEMND